jgi:predicted enzyme related to lactoylglutathione lyase
MRSRIWICATIVLSFALGMAVESVRASKADDPSARVTGIGGVFIKAHEPRKLAAWYREHLGIGLQAGGDSPNAPSFSTFEWTEKGGTPGSTAFAIFSDQSKYFAPSSSQFMINFRVTNLDAVLAQLKEAGVTVDSKVDSEPNGKFGWAMDPEGNRVELWEPNGK